MKQSVLQLSIEDFLQFNLDIKSYQNKLLIVEMHSDDTYKSGFKEGVSVRLDAFSIFLVRRGTIDITIDDFTYHLSDNLLLDIMDMHQVKNMRLSPHFLGYHLIIEKNLFAEIILNSRRMPAAYIATRRSRPVLKLNEEDADLLESYIHRIERNMDRSGHAWHRDLIFNELRGFLLEMNNIIYQALHEHVHINPPSKDTLLFLFIQLLDKHCKEEHSVAFYARELCITPEYLSRILKDFSGKTVNKWIAEALMREAEICLRDPEFTVQQVADMLNFSDQSSFGKFFKKHKGVSPLMYRANIDVS
ncbi:helix-turn-helix domain-containing protein [Parabacteroides bouchesdurhonensis]|uniref:helix-turn-helix domain-containing protein n=1 Tax=Parabacteroides bouchesdurhonensis TaxID=1936995 RepID=UPI001D0C5FA2|nr:helix-turn-helix transcriptional regulator [Parabacteroides bouchesdurhonensis]